MKPTIDPRLEAVRITSGPWRSYLGERSGAFLIIGPMGRELKIIASDGDGEVPWEHVSVSLSTRCPNWPEMCFVKDLFWSDDEVVMQLHPAKANYVNNHPYCLHLWAPIGGGIPLPPTIAV